MPPAQPDATQRFAMLTLMIFAAIAITLSFDAADTR